MKPMKAALFLACFALCGAAVAGSSPSAVAGVQRNAQTSPTSSGNETSFRITNIRTAPGAPSSSLIPQPVVEDRKKGSDPKGTGQPFLRYNFDTVFVTSFSVN